MRTWRTIGVILIGFAVGCQANQQADTAPKGKHTYSPGSEPKVGSKVILPDEVVFYDLYRNVKGCRRAQELIRADKVNSPEWEENDPNRIHVVLSAGDLVEVLEIGPDYVGIFCLKDGFGGKKEAHGYIGRWW